MERAREFPVNPIKHRSIYEIIYLYLQNNLELINKNLIPHISLPFFFFYKKVTSRQQTIFKNISP